MNSSIDNEDIINSGMYIQYKADYPYFSDKLIKSMAYEYYDLNNSFIKKEQYYREVSRHDLQLDEPELLGEELEKKVERWTYESMYFYKRNMNFILMCVDDIRENGVKNGLTDEQIELQVAEEKRKFRWLE